MIKKSDLEELYNGGFSLDKIAKRYSLSRAGVQYWMEKYKIPKRQRYESGFLGYWGACSTRPLPKMLTIGDVKELYFNQGLSAEDIAKLFNRTNGAVYRFMKRNSIERRTAKDTNNLKYLKKEPSFKIKEKLTAHEEKLKIAGIMLYWAEGYKNSGKNIRGGTVDLANSDPKMVGTFLKFLRIICGVDEDKLRVQLYCYVNQNIDFLKKYWSGLTKIPLRQFMKPYIRQDFQIEKSGKMKYGLVHVRYADKKLFLQIQNWTEKYLKTINIK